MKIPNLDPSESDSLYQKYLHIKYTTEQEEYTQLIPKQNFWNQLFYEENIN